MNQAINENSSLELYETAYKLHYIDGNIPEACRIYKVLIDEFPNSNECGYAVIQLQKILANDVADRLKKGKPPALLSIVLALCVALCLTLSFISFTSLKKAATEIETLSLVSEALSIMYGGNDNDALELLDKAKAISRGAMKEPYLLSANIFMNMQHFSQARAEFETYQKISGKIDSVFQKMVTVKIEKEKNEKQQLPARIDSAAAQTPATSVTETTTPAATFKPERMMQQQPTMKPKPKNEKTRPVRPVRKSPSTNSDSVSFF
jgi:hypothetical protein